ncbi:transcriptional regulator, TetR family [Sporobacter termitidis DSM 10068]|uniref:Transcriptional regulator, TetR family n=1 Tax=Sporobacter termitidis DSM 10068 TaxID=1123282 RepID=A0A1M5YSB6_9FIRM|nr:TetR/AcrR family transcriptional regulator [Sporobacter termitidis]SHI14750.1 transcriptional regulator, TetR family [Sporobacter termitidis DSM 10068]
MADEMNTQEKILYFGRKEFLQKSFQNASLRNIASAAGMTTGAIYTYFKDKNALFEAIVAPVYEQVEKLFVELSASYYNAGGIVGEITTQNTTAELYRVYRLIYDNFDVFRLLVVGAEGSSKADFVHTIVDHEVTQTLAYLDRLKKAKGINAQINRTVLHLISESYINTLLEPVRHNMSYEEAIENLDFLAVFYTGGWKSIFYKLFDEKNI